MVTLQLFKLPVHLVVNELIKFSFFHVECVFVFLALVSVKVFSMQRNQSPKATKVNIKQLP